MESSVKDSSVHDIITSYAQNQQLFISIKPADNANEVLVVEQMRVLYRRRFIIQIPQTKKILQGE